jgi:integrase
MNRHDRKQPGLVLRIRPSGHKCWYFVYSHRNRVRWYRVGQVKVTEARKIAAKHSYEVAQGRDPQAEKLAQRTAGTFGELHQRYVTEWAEKRNRSWKQAARLVERHLLPHWSRRDVKSITRADVRAALARIASPTVANQTRAAASAVFSYGVKMEVVQHNPCTGIDANPTKARSRVLSDSEIAAFWPSLTPVLKTILLTGQRPGEVERMLHLHIKDGWWQMPGKPDKTSGWPGTKNSEDHRVWLSAPVRELIGDGDSGCVFKRGRAARVMQSICAKLGIEDTATPHDLRRTFGTFVTRLGFGRQAMDRILNHRDRSVGTIYDRYAYATEDQRIMEAVAKHVLKLAKGQRETATVVPLR